MDIEQLTQERADLYGRVQELKHLLDELTQQNEQLKQQIK